ncbi:phospholipase D-like domain-containing protein [Streptomyces celluloflavus]|uniref:XRE family transcriptional regulator n=1 Tax=Streptomyces celluloflavus TaxID=58344 RepID=UPI00366A4D45
MAANATPEHCLGTVSMKQVQRWLEDAGLTPHAENRATTASALGVDEEMLWPKAVQERIKTGNDRELVRSYPYRSACPSPVWDELIESAGTDIFLAGYTNYFFWSQVPRFADTLRRKVESGCRVRFLLGDPGCEITHQRETIENVALSVSTRIQITLENLDRLGPLQGLETRFSAPLDAAHHVSLSVFRFDDDALVTPHLARLVGHDSPLLHLHRRESGGMFDRFAEHIEELWEKAEPARVATE